MQSILQSFCAIPQTDSRMFLERPMRIGKLIYATNGHIGIRVPDDGVLDAVDNVCLSHFPAMFDAVVEYMGIPELPAKENCDFCKGAGKRFKEPCEDCDGDGYFHHGNHTYTCKECDGDGIVEYGDETKVVPCHVCDGSGLEKNKRFKIEVNNYSVMYLYKISALPNAKIQTGAIKNYSMRFVFDGGEGLLMPLRD